MVMTFEQASLKVVNQPWDGGREEDVGGECWLHAKK